MINIITKNKATVEPFSKLIEQASLSLHSDIHFDDAFSEQENDEFMNK